MNKEYRLAVAFLQFKHAYKELVKASTELPDLDVSAAYPFFLLDFEAMSDAVLAWCSIQATMLLRELPDKVDNPACVRCHYFRIGFGPDGLCKAAADKGCNLFPFIVFSREQVEPFMRVESVRDLPKCTDAEVFLKYVGMTEEIYEYNLKSIPGYAEARKETMAPTAAQSDFNTVAEFMLQPNNSVSAVTENNNSKTPAFLRPATAEEFRERVERAAERNNQEAGG